MTEPTGDLFGQPCDLGGAERFEPTREAALARLAAFASRMGGRYKSRRNYDLGPGRRDNVSRLSPYVRRRLVTEKELVAVALSAHAPASAEKFVQEVFWRTYFKGWLEMRPQVWRDYRIGLEADLARLAQDRSLAKRLAEAEEGRTGIDCFDAWAAELTETGYLHNHTRMWMASIWIFTLRLPWRLGADFFLRHLLDGDPASNTLGWRWVAGLHTRGKHYVAAAWNIEKFTGGRFNPVAQLADRPPPLSEDAPPPPAAPPRAPAPIDRAAPTLLLVTEEDGTLETLGELANLDIRAVAPWSAAAGRSPTGASEAASAFDAGALADAAGRASAAYGAPISAAPTSPADLGAFARDLGATQIVTGFAPVGWTSDALSAARQGFAAADVTFGEGLRLWDELSWPYATAGFFKLKTKIPALVRDLI